MTPERLGEIIRSLRRAKALPQRKRDIARALRVTPVTLRRWLSGETPIPGTAEVLLEVFSRWPEIAAEALIHREEEIGEDWREEIPPDKATR